MERYLPLIIYFLPQIITIIGMTIINFTKEKETMRIEWDKVAQFCGFLAMLFVFRVCSESFLVDAGLSTGNVGLPIEISQNLWSIGLVFWEDFFFAVPIYFMMKYMKRRWLAIAITIALSALFASGHMYEGPRAVFVTFFLPYFVTYQYGKKYGFGTTMCCHVLYDFSTILVAKMIPYILS